MSRDISPGQEEEGEVDGPTDRLAETGVVTAATLAAHHSDVRQRGTSSSTSTPGDKEKGKERDGNSTRREGQQSFPSATP